MLDISIKGLTDGKHSIDLTTECAAIEKMFPEFFGAIVVSGTLQKFGNRYIFAGSAECDAVLVCDRSGDEFVERIAAPLALEYIANTTLYLAQANEEDPEPPFYIREDDTILRIGEAVRQELAVNLPLKRVAPELRDKDFSELYPELDADSEAQQEPGERETDPRWSALKKISFS
jgi:uncharacterized metal-binding protein YceD (DUF177 family)